MARAREYLNRSSILITSLKTRVLIDLKAHFGRVPDGDFFDNWHMDSVFLSIAVWKISTNFTHTLM